MYINEINEIYKNKKQNIHIIIIFLLILIFICIWQKYDTNESFFNPTTTIAKESQPLIYNLPPGKIIANLPDFNRSYSSFFTDGTNVFNKSRLDSTTCWAPSKDNSNNPNQHIKFMITNPTMIYGVAVMGRADFIYNYVTSFTVTYNSNVEAPQIPVDNGVIYNSNLYKYIVPDGMQTSYILFKTPVFARTMFIKPKTWEKSIAMRADLLINLPEGASAGSYTSSNGSLIPNTTKYIVTEINSPISSPVFIPKTPLATGYVSYNTDISDALKSSYNDIKKERNINLDNQERINKIDKRINKIKQDIGGINNSSSKKSIVKTPSFY